MYSERASLTASTRRQGVALDLTATYDFATGDWNEARLRASTDGHRHRGILGGGAPFAAVLRALDDLGRVRARRIQRGAHDGRLASARPAVQRRAFISPIASTTPRTPGSRFGRTGGARAATPAGSATAAWSAYGSYDIDLGNGASATDGRAGMRWTASKNLLIGFEGSVTQTIYEYRIGTGRVYGAALNGAAQLAPDVRVVVDGGIYRQMLTNGAAGPDWSQRRILGPPRVDGRQPSPAAPAGGRHEPHRARSSSRWSPRRAAPVQRSNLARRFPHASHESLFPTCLGCHAGVPAGNAASAFPSPALCARCHDGDTCPASTGSRRRRAGRDCSRSRIRPISATPRTSAARPATPPPATEVDERRARGSGALHELPRAPGEHASGRRQRLRHVPSSARRGDRTHAMQRVAALPKPPSHARAGLRLGTRRSRAHAANANCATCHARESCARCHVDAGRSTVIRALGPDHADRASGRRQGAVVSDAGRSSRVRLRSRRTERQPGRTRRVARPVTRGRAARRATPARALRSVLRQAAGRARGRHARRPAAADRRSDGGRRAAHGVQRHAPPASSQRVRQADSTHKVLVHPPGFSRSHGPVASSGAQQCASCHAQRFCTDCHVGELAGRRYHPVELRLEPSRPRRTAATPSAARATRPRRSVAAATCRWASRRRAAFAAPCSTTPSHSGCSSMAAPHARI